MASGNSNGMGIPEGVEADDTESEDEAESDADNENEAGAEAGAEAEAEGDAEDGEEQLDSAMSVNEIVKNWEICKYCLSSLCSIIQHSTDESKLSHYRILMEELLLHTYHQGILKRVTF